MVHAIPKSFKLLKLNGSTGGISNQKDGDIRYHYYYDKPHYQNNNFDEMIFMTLNNYAIWKTKNRPYRKPTIAFAWENQGFRSDKFVAADITLQATNILIIIGYSFPCFNREVDKFLIERRRFDRVVIQSPKHTIDQVASHFRNINRIDDIKIDRWSQVDQFYMV